MAKDKTSFILYSDYKEHFEILPDDIAGKLIKHIFRYVNDGNPESQDLILNVAFNPIKQHLKRDLKKFEDKKVARKEAGKLGGVAKASNAKKTLANLRDSVSDSVTVNKKRVKAFTPPSLQEVTDYFKENGYNQASAFKAFNYYNTADWKDSTGKKVQNWKQKMIAVWFKNDNKEIKTSQSFSTNR